MLTTVLLVILILLAIGAAPGWGWHSAGYAPSGLLSVVLIVLLVLFLMGRV